MQKPLLLAAALTFALGACTQDVLDRQTGTELNIGDFGNATMNNTLVHSGQRDYVMALATRFGSEVPDTINFAFNSSALDGEARQILARQATWIKQFPEVRFRVYGHTDLVGSAGYNHALGMRRARAAVDFLVSQGISRSRLEAVVSFGKTRPIVQTNQAEVRNRRTVTEVSGFVGRHPTVLQGKYAEVIFREYIDLAKRPHPPVTTTANQTVGSQLQ
ncbi:MAG TPA: OmpA family protein [Paracoccaceae bacterium]|nr:OmpA family protein [Paracoccaceae bacterium]